jgi:HK97 family phage major capsid protein
MPLHLIADARGQSVAGARLSRNSGTQIQPEFSQMSLTQARELREKRAKLVADAQALELNSETRSKFDALMAEADVLKADIDRIEKAEAEAAELRSAVRPPENKISETATEDRSKKHAAAFRSYLMNGPVDMPAEQRSILAEYRDMGTGGGNALQGTGGGYFVPVGFINDVEQALKYYGPMLKVARLMPTASGQPLPYPTSNDTGNIGELVGEGAQVTTQDVTLSNLVLGAYKFSTKMVKVSIELLQDSAFDVEAFLKQQFAIRLGRILNTKFTTGTGTNEPKGIITAATLGATAVGSAGNDGTSATGANSIGSDDLISLEHSVDPLYRQGAKFMMNDATLKSIKQLKDKQGRPLWLPGVAANAPDTILNYEYVINNDMATIATTNKTVVFGALDKYLVRQVKELSVLRLAERFADFGQVAFIGFARYDGNLLDAGTHPVKYLQQA